MAASISPNDDGVTSVVTTGVRSEKHSFTWIIKNFNIIRTSDELLKGQKFNFEAGSCIGLPTTWRIYLTHCDRCEQYPRTKWISIYLKLLKAPTDVKEVTAEISLNCRKANGRKLFKSRKFSCAFPINNSPIPQNDWGFSHFINWDILSDDLPLVDGSLIIETEFILYAIQPQMLDIPSQVKEFEGKANQQLIKDLGQVHSLTGEGNTGFLAKIISTDKVEFPVNRGILSARSIVFQRMFQSGMKESETGVVHIDDLSGKTVRVLLHYLTTGTLHQDWNSPEVIVELPYAAHKYEIKLLVDFLDNVLGKVCTRDNAKQLGILARQLDMKKAEEELFKYIRNNAKSMEDITIIT